MGLFSGVSVAATLLGSNQAAAQCAPNPAQDGAAAICSGTEAAGLRVTGNATVNVQAGAVVQTSTAGAGAIAVTTRDNVTPTLATITVAATAQVAGPIGIDVSSSFGPRATVILDNSGTIAGTTGGYALRGSDTAGGRFELITNRAGGTIGAIHGQVGTLTNAGKIEGGALSAFADAPGSLQFFGQGTVVNSGTMRATGSADTVFFTRNFNFGPYVRNSGLIVNGGTGRAVAGQTILSLVNEAEGRIVSRQTAIGAANFLDITNSGTITGGLDAIVSGGYMSLVNRGTINGNVRTATFNSIIDNGGGTINGSLLLGNGDDVFIGDTANPANPIGTITGIVNAGGGTDTLRLIYLQDTTLDEPIRLPDTIERVGLRVGKSSTLTISQSFSGTSGLTLGGGDPSFYNIENQFVLNGTIDAQGPALLTDNAAPGGFGVTNTGSIRSTLAAPGDFAVSFSQISRFINSGSIFVTGGGGLSIPNVEIGNSGSILADGTAVSGNRINNSGTIRSLLGIGVALGGSGPTVSINSGRIEGDVAGARFYYATLQNSGTISSARNGIEIGIAGTVDNLAGGIISGGAKAVGPSTAFNQVMSARIFNAGTINGSIDFGSADSTSSNVFVALPGGLVNGDIQLGSGGDIFVTSMVNDGPGEFAGLTGRVTGSGKETLRYFVTEGASATAERKGIFSGLGYDLSNGAKLTLTSPVPLGFGLSFAGSGTVDLTADLAGTGTEILLDLHQTSLQRDAEGMALPTAIDLTSRGTIAVTRTQFFSAAIALAQGDRFTNAGVIAAAASPPDPNTGQAPFAAIFARGGTVANTGTIRVAGAIGVRGSTFYGEDGATVINAGVIEQLSGGPAATGIVDIGKIINTGQIRTDGPAISFSGSTAVTNSGSISSALGSAIQSTGFGHARIDNQRGGTIAAAAGFAAMRLGSGSIVRNAGTITGDVVLNDGPFGPSGSVGPVIYVNAGGTLAGNLTLSSGKDVLVALDGATGVSGTINAGQGFDTLVRGYTASTAVDLSGLSAMLPSGFEWSGVGAYRADTTVTLTSPSLYLGPLVLVGDGSIVNTANIDTRIPGSTSLEPEGFLRLGHYLDPTNEVGAGSSLAFTNQARIESGVAGDARLFDNRGHIGANSVSGLAVGLYAANSEGLTFRNSGTIAGASVFIDQWSSVDRVAGVTFDNSGTIESRLSISSRGDRFSFINTGRIVTPQDTSDRFTVWVGRSYAYGAVVNTALASFDNAGTILGGLRADVVAKQLAVSNSGVIDADQDYRALSLDHLGVRVEGQEPYDSRSSDQESLGLTNAGTIAGTVLLNTRAPVVTIANTGNIATREDMWGTVTLETYVQSYGDQTIAIVNGGTIAAPGRGASALSLGSTTLAEDGALDGSADVAIRLTNSGTIRADGGAVYSPTITVTPFPGVPPYTVPEWLSGLTAITIQAPGAGTGGVTIVNEASGVISAAGATQSYVPTDPLPAAYRSVGSLAIGITADSFTLDNAGTIRGGTGGVIAPGTEVGLSFILPDLTDGYLAGAIQTFGAVDTITNRATGVIVGSIDLGDFDDMVVNRGRIDGDLFLRTGNDSLWHALAGSITGVADGGDGIDRLTIDLTGGGTLDLARFIDFEEVSFIGSGSLGTSGPLAIDTVALAGGDLQVAAGQSLATAGPNTVTGTDANESVSNAGSIDGNVTLLGGDDTLANSGAIGGSVLLGSGNDRLTNSGSIGGGVDMGVGNDSFTGAGTVAGPVQLGAGDDVADLPALAGAAGGIDGGTGTDQLRIAVAANTTANLTAALAGRLTNFETIQATGPGTINAAGTLGVGSFLIDGATVNIANGTSFGIAGPAAITGGATADRVVNAGTIAGALDLGGGDNQVTNQGTITGTVATGSGNDTFANGGLVTGNVDLGGGNNTLTLQTGGSFGGTVTAGSGTGDLLQVNTTGTYLAPTVLNGLGFLGFETLQNLGGTTQLTGSFTGGVNVIGGNLFGVQGSTIAGNVMVGTGAQFGTAGTINGNVNVGTGGTLAPGASPGVMTVNGNVSLASGSTSIFEFVPAPGQSDQLLISGSLTIASNAVLTMTGTRPLTPGVNYDLIVANGGITGTFATINQPATIGGFLRYTVNRLQLMGTFLAPAGLTVQQAAAVNYVNVVMIAGQGSATLFAAVPQLLNAGGTTNAAAFNLLTAEAYASAAQLGVQNALTLAQAGRSGIVRTTRETAGLFGFAQGMGDRRTLKANRAIGTSQAKSESWGVLGGIGYGVDGASIGAFVGRLDGKQRIAALGARTEGDGMIAGLAGHFAVEGFEVGLLGAYDWTNVDTSRAVPGGAVGSADYRLRGLTLDASVGATISVGADWAVRPEAGITHVEGNRGAARETGSPAFALDIDRGQFSATFVDTSIALKGGQAAGATFHPWLQAGIRGQIAGGFETASGGFVGGASRFVAFGVGRKEKVGTAGAGLSYDIDGVTLYAAYRGEFGGGNGHNGNVGVRLGF